MRRASYRHYGCRITDDLVYKGFRTVFLENDLVRVGVLLDKGADLFQFLYKPTDTDFLWRAPNGLLDARRSKPTSASGAGAFLDSYHGGWQEIFPGGGPMVYQGAEIGLHGEVTHLGWDCEILVDDPEEIAVQLSCETLRTPFRLERTMRLVQGSPVLFITERLTNLSPTEHAFMWGHHPAFGPPFLKQGVRLYVPAATGQVHDPQFAQSGIFNPGETFDWPLIQNAGERLDLSRVPGPEAGFADLIYLSGLTEGWYAVQDPEAGIGFGLAWPLEVFPYLWFWLAYGRAPGYPWWDRVYCLALEPWTSIPNSFELAQASGNLKTLKGGASIDISLTAVVTTKKEAISRISLDGTYL